MLFSNNFHQNKSELFCINEHILTTVEVIINRNPISGYSDQITSLSIVVQQQHDKLHPGFSDNSGNNSYKPIKFTLVHDKDLTECRKKHTASLEMMANSPGLTPCLPNSLAAYPYSIKVLFTQNKRKGYIHHIHIPSPHSHCKRKEEKRKVDWH